VGGDAQALAAAAQRGVVLVGRGQPGLDAQALLDLVEPGRQGAGIPLGQAEMALPPGQRGLGVRKLLVQLTVVEPPTQRPCRMVMALSAVLRAALSW
jgi:hypothetical protein